MKTIILALIGIACSFAQTSRAVDLAWEHTGITTGFNVYRAAGSCAAASPAPVFAKLNPAAITEKRYTDNSVVTGQVYCYRVTAIAGALESIPSNTAEAPIAPYPPNNLTVTVQVTVTVDAPKP